MKSQVNFIVSLSYSETVSTLIILRRLTVKTILQKKLKLQ